jgi:hypothetical protein
MLFTDRMFCTAEALSFIDGELSNVAKAESLDISDAETSVLWHYTLSAGEKLLSRVQNFSGYLVGVGVNSNHAAAVMNVLSTAINRPRALLQQITVAEPDHTRHAFARWCRYSVLKDFYQNVFRRKLNDRYERKMNDFAEEEKAHWTILKGRGLPIILSPLAAPGAIWTYGAGTWGSSNVTTTAGGSQPGAATYDVSITWCSLPAYVNYANQNGAESAGSIPQSQAVAANHVLQINLAGLNPPTSIMPVAIGTAQGIFAPMNATHWNVYVGPQNGARCLQNAVPIPIATTTYTLADVPVVNGNFENAGQPAQYDFSIPDGLCWRA